MSSAMLSTQQLGRLNLQRLRKKAETRKRGLDLAALDAREVALVHHNQRRQRFEREAARLAQPAKQLAELPRIARFHFTGFHLLQTLQQTCGGVNT